MGIARKGVFSDGHLGEFSPRGIRAQRGAYCGIARIGGIAHAACQIHRLIVGCEAAGSFVKLGVHFSLYHLGLFPLAFFILHRHHYISVFGACDTAQLVACHLIAGRGEIELIVVIACQHRRVVGTA